MPTNTTHYAFQKPTVGGDSDVWGGYINDALDEIDALLGGTQAVKAIRDTVYALSGTTPALSAANGAIQTWTLTGNSSPTDSLSSGDSITLLIDDGTAYTITWPSVTWKTNGGSAPTLQTTGVTVVALWKVSSTLYGARVGDA